ncbi:MAG TPA: Mov34/MPN/PAD-1 family protein [Bryobacteraceae bacterium]|nr:Mov34/MPN/PAD-1 family protein [Bryobacteraceae bacterium]
MMPAQNRVDAGIWNVPGLTPVIEYSRVVLNEILVKVVDAFDTYLAGGYEVGGVLLGHREGDTIRILAFRPIEVTPPRPSFVLSKSDEQRLTVLLDSIASDPDLRGMEAVGWYHSHTRSEIFLSEADVEIYDRHFPEPWQVAMVIHPSDLEPVRIGFFFRETDGFIRTDQSYHEFVADSPRGSNGLRRPSPWELTEDGRLKDERVPEVEPEAQAPPPEPCQPSVLRRAASRVLLFCALLVIGSGAASLVVLRQPPATLGLRIIPSEGELIIQWDPANPALRDGQATLFITDGANRVELPVTPERRNDPKYYYKPLTGRVDIRLRTKLSWGRLQQEAATYLVHPDIGKPSPELQEAQRQNAEAEQETEAARRELLEAANRSEKLRLTMEDLAQQQQQISELKTRQRLAEVPKPKPAAAPKELPKAPEIPSRAIAQVAPPVQIPSVDPRLRPPASEPPPRPSPIPPAQTNARPAPPLVASTITPMPKSGYAGPLAGKIIWTGDLPRDGVLTIEGRKPSRGAVNAELPGVAVRVGAYPAELSNDGLRVLTANARFGAGKVEPPSAANGYTKTVYVYDPKSVRDLIVEQMPGSDWKRIVLRAGGRRLSAIVIEWQVATQ